MRKAIFLLCLLLCLCACQSTDVSNIGNELDKAFSETEDIGYYHINNFMEDYSYYLPSDMSEEALDSDSIVMRYNDSRIIMNLNVSNIINSKYYTKYLMEDDGFFDEAYLFYKNSGGYETFEGLKKSYIYRLYDYEGTYVFHLLTNDMNYYGTAAKSDLKTLVRHLMTIAKNTTVATDDIISTYSNKDVIDYRKKQIDLFDSNLPTNGELSNLLVVEDPYEDGNGN